MTDLPDYILPWYRHADLENRNPNQFRRPDNVREFQIICRKFERSSRDFDISDANYLITDTTDVVPHRVVDGWKIGEDLKVDHSSHLEFASSWV